MEKITAADKKRIDKKFNLATTVLSKKDSFITYEINYRSEQLEIISRGINSDITMFPQYAFLADYYHMYVTYDHGLKKSKMIIF